MSTSARMVVAGFLAFLAVAVIVAIGGSIAVMLGGH